jgi:hypothetical protein
METKRKSQLLRRVPPHGIMIVLDGIEMSAINAKL